MSNACALSQRDADLCMHYSSWISYDSTYEQVEICKLNLVSWKQVESRKILDLVSWNLEQNFN